MSKKKLPAMWIDFQPSYYSLISTAFGLSGFIGIFYFIFKAELLMSAISFVLWIVGSIQQRDCYIADYEKQTGKKFE